MLPYHSLTNSAPFSSGYPDGISRVEIEDRLRDLCMTHLNLLTSVSLVVINDDTTLTSSNAGQLMARYCISYQTMKTLNDLSGGESLKEMVGEPAFVK